MEEKYKRLILDVDDERYLYYTDEKFGIMNLSLKKITEPVFDSVLSDSMLFSKTDPFKNGILSVQVGEKWGFVDINGKTIGSIEYDSVGLFSHGFAAVKKNGKWGYVNKKGELKIDFFYDSAYAFDHNDVAVVSLNEKYHLIDKKNKNITGDWDQIIKPKDASNIYAMKDSKGFILLKSTGVFFTEDTYENVIDIVNNAVVIKDGTVKKIIIYNLKGKILTEYKGVCRVFMENNKLTVVNKADINNIVVWYDNTEIKLSGSDLSQVISSDLFITKKNDKYGVTNKNGESIIDYKYEGLHYTDDNFYIFKLNDKYGVMNQDGDIIVSAVYEDTNIYYSPSLFSFLFS